MALVQTVRAGRSVSGDRAALAARHRSLYRLSLVNFEVRGALADA